MKKLTQSYVIAVLQGEKRALEITKKLTQTRKELAEISIELTDETLQTMAQDAWETYAKAVNGFEPKEL